MKQILGLIVMMGAAGGGVAVSNTVKTRSLVTVQSDGGAKEDGAYDKTEKSKADGKSDDKKDGGKAKGDKAASADAFSLLRFKRQFIVPEIGQDGVDALIILNLAIELDDKAGADIFSHEPKFRDAFVRELLALSRNGAFGQDLTSTQTYELLRATLLQAAKDVRTEGIKDVLILDMAKQER
jgi:hypothetical protein